MKFTFKREKNRLNIFQKLKATLRLREAINKADNAHNNSGERYYVMPTSGTSGDLIIMDRANFRKLKQKGYISRSIYTRDLERECFYCTPYRNGSGELHPDILSLKREQYFSWVAATIKARKNEKEKK